MSGIENVSRRSFLQGTFSASALVLSVPLWFKPSFAQPEKADVDSGSPTDRAILHPSVFVGVETDGTVHIMAARAEMGTGIATSLPRVLADELDADWTRVQIHLAQGNTRYGDQDTDGSHSVRSFFDPMRVAGATARQMLVAAAAAQWGVPVSDCTTSLHAVVYNGSGQAVKKRADYRELASAAAKLPVPPAGDLKFKARTSWRYIGKDAKLHNLNDIVTGKAVYGIDADIPGMLYASVEHPPVLGGTVVSYDNKAPLQVAGVSQTVTIDRYPGASPGYQPLGGVAVIADNTWSAFQGRSKLQVKWDNGPNASYNSLAYKQELQTTARQPGKVARAVGDVDSEFSKGGRIVEAEYYAPHLAHVSMEPPTAVADFRDGKVTIWAPTQNPQGLQEEVGRALKIDKKDVVCNVTLLGGGFGRKSFPDFAVEAAILSKELGKPIKVCWSREDDVKFDYYHSVAAMYMKAALGADGRPTAWLQRSVFPSMDATFDVKTVYGSGEELGMGWVTVPFDIPNLRIENGPATMHVRIGWFRSVANVYHAFGVQSFAAELANAAGQDPLDYLIGMVGPPRVVDLKNSMRVPRGYELETGRLRQVIELAADKGGWGKHKLGAGVGMGIAAHWSFLTYVATVVQVEVNAKGVVSIRRVDTAVDAGTIVNPIGVRAQFEGAAIFGASLALCGEITATGGAIDQSNFDDYPVLRNYEAPKETNVYLVNSSAGPAGVGEPGVPPIAPALCNAIFAATGKRIRELPIRKHLTA